jgi:hypothetical protein
VTLREGFPYGKVYRHNPKHLCPNLNGYRDNGLVYTGVPGGTFETSGGFSLW